MFSLAVLLAKEKRLALPPLNLGSPYARLEMSAHEISSVQSVDMTSSLTPPFLSSDVYMGKIWALSPKPVEFKAVKPEKVVVNGEEREKTSHNKPKVVQGHG